MSLTIILFGIVYIIYIASNVRSCFDALSIATTLIVMSTQITWRYDDNIDKFLLYCLGCVLLALTIYMDDDNVIEKNTLAQCWIIAISMIHVFEGIVIIKLIYDNHNNHHNHNQNHNNHNHRGTEVISAPSVASICDKILMLSEEDPSECPVCLEVTNLMLVTCKHHLCKSCAKLYIESQGVNAARRIIRIPRHISCPVCRSKCTLFPPASPPI